MKKSNIFLTLSLVLLVVVSITSSTFVFADELQPNAILNFNQQFNYYGRSSLYNVNFNVGSNFIHIEGLSNNNGYAYVNGTSSSTGSNTFLANHKYYVDIKSSDNVSNIGLYNGGWQSTAVGHLQTLLEYPADRVRYVTIQLVNGVSYNTNLQANIVDLTLMYGLGNEPNLDQCKSIFTTYYTYTPSYLLTLDNMESYQNGVASVLGAQTLELIPKVIFNNASSIDYYIDVSGSKQNISTFTKYTNPISYDFTGYLKFDLLTTLKAGTEITISDINSSKYGASYYPSFGYMYNTTFVELKPYNSYNGSVSFVVPVDVNNITFANLDLYTTTLNSFTISYKTSDINLILYNMYQEGVNSVDTDYYYKLGYYDGQQVDVIDDGLSVMGKIFAGVGNMLNIHVYQGITIGTLLLIPLLFMVLFFVLKLARG